MTKVVSNKSFFDLSAFISTLILSLYFNSIGYVYIGEIIALFYIIFKKVKLPPNFIKASKLIILWVIAQTLSDLINGTPFQISLKGVSAPILLICTAIFFYDYFLINPKRIISFFIALAFTSLIQTIYYQPELFLPNPWKWGIAVFVNIFFALWYSYQFKKVDNKILFLFTIFYFVFSNSVSARSIGGICLGSYIIYVIIKKPSISTFLKKLIQSNFGMARILLTLIFLLFLLNMIATNLFLSDFYLSRLDEKAREKSFSQASSEYGALIGGRSESLISVIAFLDKPLLGHGSWAKDDGNYIDRYIDIISVNADENDEKSNREWSKDLNLIPCHSFLMGAVVWGGVFAGLFWLFILGKIIRVVFLYGDKVNYFFVYMSVAFFWDILFSPFGYDHRYTSAAIIAFLLFYENKLKSEQLNNI